LHDKFDAVKRAPVAQEPFLYFLAEGVLTPQTLAAIKTDFPVQYLAIPGTACQLRDPKAVFSEKVKTIPALTQR
jgi:hypothetical protein